MLKGKCYSCALICAISQAAILQSALAADKIIRVDRASGSSTGDGTAWGSFAYRYLQEGIEDAASWVNNDPDNNTAQIWVADGTYKPNEFEGTVSNCSGTSHQRCYSFQMHDDVRWYGGFEGDETDRNQRAPLVNITILSGDIDSDNITDADNSYHVVTADRVDATAIIDGFHVIRGYAADAPAPESGVPAGGGAGLLVVGDSLGGTLSRPVILRIHFTNHIADFGGAVYIYTGQATNGTQFFNCEFRDNTAGDGDGGAFKSELRGQAGTLFPAGNARAN